MNSQIEVGMFCTVHTSKHAEFGVKRTDLIYVAGDTVVSIIKKDPYALRRLFIASFTKDKGHIDLDKKAFMCDGKHLKPVSNVLQEKYKGYKLEDFSKEEEGEEACDAS